jgi:ArsR family transcriptional regulator
MLIPMPAAAATKLNVRPISRLFKALGDETRLRIVALLSHGELCVCHVEAALELTQSNASRQLGILRSAGIVASRRELNWVYYHLAAQDDPDCERQMKALVGCFAKQAVLKADVQRLVKVRGPQSCG